MLSENAHIAEDVAEEFVEEGEFLDDLKPGTELLHGQYKIEEFLNSGGFGITYLARDSLERLVVIKECFPGSFCRRANKSVQPRSRTHLQDLSSIVRLFAREAQSLAKVGHPNIVGVHQVFEDNNTAYMALDYVRGRDLLDILSSDDITLTPDQIKGYLQKLLDAIGFVHKNSLLHRDISPDNIIIRDDGEPVLIDFGAAREQASRKSRVLSALRVVKDGYSPQEFYVQGSEQNESCDLYSLAASFYHIITGNLPPDSQVRLAAYAAGDPDPYVPLAEATEEYDENFCAALDKAMSVLPRERVQSAADWLDMMEGKMPVETAAPVQPAQAGQAPAAIGAPKKSGLSMMLGTTALVAAAGVGIYLMAQSDREAARQQGASTAAKAPVEAPVPTIAEAPAPTKATPAPAPEVAAPNRVAEVAPIAPIAAEPVFTVTEGSPLDDTAGTFVAPAATTEFGSVETAVVETAPVADSEIADTAPAATGPTGAQTELAVATPEAQIDAPVADAPVADTVVADVLATEAPVVNEIASAVGVELAAPIAEEAVVPIQISDASPVMAKWQLELPFSGDNANPGAIAQVSDTAPSWASEDSRVLSVNGTAITSLKDIPAIVLAGGSEGAPSVDVTFGVLDQTTQTVSDRLLTVPVVRDIALLNGLSFRSAFVDGTWITTVSQVPEGSSLSVGDVIVAHMADSQRIDGPDTLEKILRTQNADETQTFSFAVQRDGNMWVESLTLSSL